MEFNGAATLLGLVLLFNFGITSPALFQDAWQLDWLFRNQNNGTNVGILNSYNKNNKWDFGFKSHEREKSASKLTVHNYGDLTWKSKLPLNDQILTINDGNPIEEDASDWNFEWLPGHPHNQKLTINDYIPIKEDAKEWNFEWLSWPFNDQKLSINDDNPVKEDANDWNFEWLSETLNAQKLSINDDRSVEEDATDWNFEWLPGLLNNQKLMINDDKSIEEDTNDWNFDWLPGLLNDKKLTINDDNPVKENANHLNFERLSGYNNENDEQNIVLENSLTFGWPFENHKKEVKYKLSEPTKESIWSPVWPLKHVDTKRLEPTTESTTTNSWTFGWPLNNNLSHAATPKPSPNRLNTNTWPLESLFNLTSTHIGREEQIHKTSENILQLNLAAEGTSKPKEFIENDIKEKDCCNSSSSESSEEEDEEEDEEEGGEEKEEGESNVTKFNVEINPITKVPMLINTSIDHSMDLAMPSELTIFDEADYFAENITILHPAVDYDEGSGEVDVTMETSKVLFESEQVDIEIVTAVADDYSDNENINGEVSGEVDVTTQTTKVLVASEQVDIEIVTAIADDYNDNGNINGEGSGEVAVTMETSEVLVESEQVNIDIVTAVTDVYSDNENINGTDTILYPAVDYDEGNGEVDVTETTKVLDESEQVDIEIVTEVADV